MGRVAAAIGCLALIGLCACVSTQQPSASSIHRGGELWNQCTICHSTREMQRGPLLEGREAWYVEHQLTQFKQGLRGSNPKNKSETLMASAMSKLPNQAAIRDVANWLAAQPAAIHRQTVRGDVAKGEALYQRCSSCHGPRAEGIELQHAPRLAGIEDWYLADQLRKYIKGQRGYHPDDVHGQTMRAASVGLSPQDVTDLTAYIASLGRS